MLKRAQSLDDIKLRKKEIIDAADYLYDKVDYKDLTIKTISERLSFARSSIYSYYTNKEEIMLDLLKSDYLNFLDRLINIFKDEKLKTLEDMAKEISKVYIDNMRLLDIISNHLVEIETHVTLEVLIEFKKEFVSPMKELDNSIKERFKYSPNTNELYSALIMLTHCMYPSVNPLENQKKAMDIVGMSYVTNPSDYAYKSILFILKGM